MASRSEQRADGKWWVVGIEGVDEMGPFRTKADAESDRRGVERTMAHADDRSFFTVEK